MNETNATPVPFQRLESENSIWSSSFQALLWTNWLNGINDNVFRWFVIGIGKDFADAANGSAAGASGFTVTTAFILAFGTALFVLPYLLFALPAGWLADRFSKRDVIVRCTVLEAIVMVFGVLAVYLGNIWFLLIVVFLTGAQSTLLAPAKVGKIPELLDDTKISEGNGLLNLATLTAVLIGMAVGGWLADVTGKMGQEKLWLTALVIIGNPTLGAYIATFIKRYPAANPRLKFPRDIVRGTWRDLASLYRHGALFRVAMAIVFYWSFAALGQLNVDTFVSEGGSIMESERTPMLVSLVLGVGIGSVLAGIASCGKIELGLVPWAALAMVVFAVALSFAPAHFMLDPGFSWNQIIACTLLAALGVSCGFFNVPLASYLQDRSPPASRGAIQAATNFMLFSGVMIVSVLFFPLRSPILTGSFDKIPVRYSGVQLSADETAQLDRLQREYEAAWESSTKERRPDLLTFAASRSMEAIPEKNELAALGRLVYVDMWRRQDLQEKIVIDEYIEMFPDGGRLKERMIRAVERAVQPQPLCSARQVFLLMGLATVPVFLYAVYRLPQSMLRIGLWWLLRFAYNIRLNGAKNIPDQGPVLLLSNHSSWLDGALLILMTQRRVRMIAWAGNFQNKFMLRFARFAGIILISGGPKSIMRGIREARTALENGELVCVFPEGGLSRTVQIQSFKPGIVKILEGLPVTVLPVYIDQMWGSVFTYSGGRALTKIPRTIRRPISIHVGQPIEPPCELFKLRQRLQELSAVAVKHRAGRFISPVEKFIRSCKRQKFRRKLNDSTGQSMTGGQLLMRSLILRRLLQRHVFEQGESNVGVLIPPSSGAAVVNMCLALDRRVAVNLNYTVSNEIMNQCLEHAKIKHVLTTAKVLEKFEFQLKSQLTLLDELRTKVTTSDKFWSIVLAYLCPRLLLVRILGLHRTKPDELLTIIFTSGSTGTPKGVLLSQQNIATNVDGIDQVVCLNSRDVIAGILPFFHSFGYTISMWGPMALEIAGVYHFSPLDARQVGKLVQDNAATILLATPTFLRTFSKRCTPEEFRTLQVVVVGAEKMPVELAEEFEKKYGVRPIEGYGTTELSPLVSVNVPPSRRLNNFQIDCKEGTVGRPIANVATRILDLETSAELGENQPGMLWIKGPNVMLGYLDRPDLTEKVLVDGWYNTGDVALVDSDGFIKITGRMSRFSKIGGEMVPHVTIEDALMNLAGASEGVLNLAVTAIPDPRKGERLVVLYTQLSKTPEELCKGLSAAGFPNLYIPGQDSFIQVESIPVLGSGKIDLRGLKQLALEKTRTL